MIRAAVIDPSGAYRYQLTRQWVEHGGAVTFVMLNPSTADHEKDDPTIRKCIGFARRWGHGKLYVVNLFGLRATDPWRLKMVYDPIGEDNDAWIRESVEKSLVVVAAWGANRFAAKRAQEITDLIETKWGHSLRCLGTSRTGSPKHPLYLPYATRLELYLLK